MPKIKINLDGKEIWAEDGQTILEAAMANGVKIPTLCYDEFLSPTTSCWLCVVEVEGERRDALPACATRVREGMVVRTNTDKIRQSRKLCLELLFSDHYGDCLPPCQLACPARLDIPKYITLIEEGKYREAVKVIKEKNPFPAICGRICTRPCEEACRRNVVDEPVAINFLKRFVADWDLNNGESYQPQVAPPSGKKVALIGAGPASFSCAYYLSLKGHQCTIFEALPEAGGMLRYGIPPYRLPKDILEKEIANTLTRLGVKIKTNCALGKDITLESLLKEYDAVFLGIGAHGVYKLGVEGEDSEGVISGVEFLRQVNMGKKVNLKGKVVAVVGGGNVAIDAARSSLRLGAKEVFIVYRRSRQEMPANETEIEEAEREGVKYQFLTNPVKVISSNGKVSALQCIRMKLGEPDATGRRRPEPIAGSEFKMPVDTVIVAIGQFPDVKCLEGNPIDVDRKKRITVEEGKMITSHPGVFAAGDVVTGAAIFIEAVAGGKKAAQAIDQYLKGEEITKYAEPFSITKGKLEEIDRREYADVEKKARTKMPELVEEKRLKGFEEVELGFNEKMAQREASRCMKCGCKAVNHCALRDYGLEYGADPERFKGMAQHHYLLDLSNPLIERDPNKCIRCGRCVRICLEIRGLGIFGFVNRGFDTVIEPTLGAPLAETECDSCGMCVVSCPTGALWGEFVEEEVKAKMRKAKEEKEKTREKAT